jgi:hypothetical protein
MAQSTLSLSLPSRKVETIRSSLIFPHKKTMTHVRLSLRKLDLLEKKIYILKLAVVCSPNQAWRDLTSSSLIDSVQSQHSQVRMKLLFIVLTVVNCQTHLDYKFGPLVKVTRLLASELISPKTFDVGYRVNARNGVSFPSHTTLQQ